MSYALVGVEFDLLETLLTVLSLGAIISLLYSLR
jgi:hypothetical protein